MPTRSTGTNREFRWQGPLALIGQLRRSPGITRAAAARALGLSSGSATDIVARLRALQLLDERDGPTPSTGRPSRTLTPHAQGPIVLGIDVQRDGWQAAYAGIDGQPHPLGEVPEGSPATRVRSDRFIADARALITQAQASFGARLRVISVSVAGTVQHDHVVQSAALGWDDIDLSQILPAGLPLLVGNDATLAGIAEARHGAARDIATSLHLTVNVGIGGVLIADGAPLTGATGAGGEFGHLPFGDPALRCPCGARGCWDLEVDGRAIARHLGARAPRHPERYARRILDRAHRDPAARRAVNGIAAALGRGIAGLVNAHDPAVVTLGGLAATVLATAPRELTRTYHAGLMRFRRPHPPPLVSAVHHSDGALRGALDTALDHLLTETGLDEWAKQHAAR